MECLTLRSTGSSQSLLWVADIKKTDQSVFIYSVLISKMEVQPSSLVCAAHAENEKKNNFTHSVGVNLISHVHLTF